MPKTIAQRELRNDNARVIAAVAAGETFIVTRRGVPVAELRPFPSGRRAVVPRADLVALAASGPHLDSQQFREDLDRIAGQGL